MKVAVQFFAQLRDAAGTPELAVEVPDNSTVSDVLARLYAMRPHLRDHDPGILVGVGVEFVRRDYVIQPGDELAIMPPVQGG